MTDLDAFLARWQDSAGSEKANAQLFFTELCDLLDIPHPTPAVNDPLHDRYVFERKVSIAGPEETLEVGWIDVYKDGAFVLESKQGAAVTGRGFAKRGSSAWHFEMQNALGQARRYALTLAVPPPFLLVIDVGYVFELHATFDGSTHWRPFPDPPRHRIYLKDLRDPEKLALIKAVLSDPHSLDPSKRQARVTKEIAEKVAELSRTLEDAGHPSELVAKFLMRCLFTMFAEDVGLFEGKKKLFEEYLREFWVKNPKGFPAGVEQFWRTMNTGGTLMTGEKIQRFNGGLFAQSSALPLTGAQLELLHAAARYDWSDVEPAIFGTLLERALDPKERHALGAHYTPRAYVERLVRPTLEEPLRAEWLGKQIEARRLTEQGKNKKAVDVLSAFHQRLCKIRVLDPACGSGNFLYVSLDLMKQLEAEVLREISDIGGVRTELLEMDTISVSPSQFLGIEKKEWAKEIAELVLWIGHLRWHWRMRGSAGSPPDPVLQDFHNIVCRDAVLDWDGAPKTELKRDEHGKPVKRWDGETTKKDPVTGNDVPDPNATVADYEYPNPRPAKWPKADYIVGNPPFVGNKRMRAALGDGYVEALRRAHRDVPESADFVMYWWHHASKEVRAKRAERFGLITTNSITQAYGRAIVDPFLEQGSIAFAVADHPWVDAESGAAVRIAMTVGSRERSEGTLLRITSEVAPQGGGDAVSIETEATRGMIDAGLGIGADGASAQPLLANRGLSFMGVTLGGKGFEVSAAERAALIQREPNAKSLIRPFVIGRDLTQRDDPSFVIDTFGLDESTLRDDCPVLYTRLLQLVKPARDQVARDAYRKRWWLFSEARSGMRNALAGLPVFIATCRTAKHRTFSLLDAATLVESTAIAIGISEGWVLGVLSSRAHVLFATDAGSRLGVGNDPRYNNSVCFEPFPFPDATDAQRSRIRELAERLDAHRKRQLAAHPKLSVTAMYNVLEKLRSGEPLNDKDRVIHEDGLVTLLRQIHDELDAAVFDAYGWPANLGDEEILERLVALNAERVAEEASGKVRWLRPDFQAPPEAKQAELIGMPKPARPSTPAPAKAEKQAWPKTSAEQVTALRDLIAARPAGTTFAAEDLAPLFKTRSKTLAAEIQSLLVALSDYGILFPVMEGAQSKFARPVKAAS